MRGRWQLVGGDGAGGNTTSCRVDGTGALDGAGGGAERSPVGTLLAAPIVTTIGGVALVAALVCFLTGVRAGAGSSNRSLVLYRFVLTIVLVSTPVGLVLAWIRHG